MIVINYNATVDECNGLQHDGWHHNKRIVANATLQIVGKSVVMK
jgi:hypothetical protein